MARYKTAFVIFLKILYSVLLDNFIPNKVPPLSPDTDQWYFKTIGSRSGLVVSLMYRQSPP
jgi:hypothetical protein